MKLNHFYIVPNVWPLTMCVRKRQSKKCKAREKESVMKSQFFIECYLEKIYILADQSPRFSVYYSLRIELSFKTNKSFLNFHKLTDSQNLKEAPTLMTCVPTQRLMIGTSNNFWVAWKWRKRTSAFSNEIIPSPNCRLIPKDCHTTLP